MSSKIRVLFSDEEIAKRPPGRFYMAVRTKIPLVIGLTAEDEGLTSIPPTLAPPEQPFHSDPRVLFSETRLVVYDITDHPDCPTEHTVEAVNHFLAEHLTELDRVLRDFLKER